MLRYIAKRVYKRYITTRWLARYKIAPGFYYLQAGSPTGPSDSRTIEFTLDDPRFVHLGDQLFYEPAMHWFKDAGWHVMVRPTKAMKDYFVAIEMSVIESPASSNAAIEVIPLALFERSTVRTRNVLVVDFTDSDIRSKLTTALGVALSTVTAAQGLNFEPPRRPTLTSSGWGGHVPTKSVIFSNYIDSGKFRLRSKALQDLESAASKLKKDGYTVIHVGSQKDKDNDVNSYSFIDIDLRGKTSPIDLMRLISSPEVATAVTFDNFVMHVFMMAGKPVQAKFRGRFTQAATTHHIDNVNEALNLNGGKLITYL